MAAKNISIQAHYILLEYRMESPLLGYRKTIFIKEIAYISSADYVLPVLPFIVKMTLSYKKLAYLEEHLHRGGGLHF